MSTRDDVLAAFKLLKSRIVATQAVVNNFDPAKVTSAELTLAERELTEHLEKTNTLAHSTLLLCADDKEYSTNHAKEFETLFATIRSLTLAVITHQTLKKQAKPHAAPAFKLEKIKLPQFNGSFAEWRSFHDLFAASVDKNPTLSGAEKIIHLKSCLTGEAAGIVSSFQATAADYLEAWDTVKKRYDNQREIIFAHIKKFDDAKSMTNESGTGLRGLADTMNECVRSLKVLQVPVDTWDLILIYYAMKKLDPETKKQWSLGRKTSLPSLKEFLEFLESRALALTDSSLSSKGKSQPQSGEKKNAASHHSINESQTDSTKPTPCPKCSGSHGLFRCDGFRSLPIQDRKSFIIQQNRCLNCLGKGHRAGTCTSKYRCHLCKGAHNTLLHEGEQRKSSSTTPQAVKTEVSTASQPTVVISPATAVASTSSSHCIPLQSSNHVLLLGTLMVTAEDEWGREQKCRVFVDPGSEPNFISEGCIARLGLKRKPTCVKITGVGESTPQTATGVVSFTIHSRVRDYTMDIEALVLPKVSNPMPRSTCKATWPHLNGLELGDPLFNKPSKIDILLGCAAAAKIKLDGLIHGPDDGPVAHNTQFGWLLTGLVGESSHSFSFHTSTHHAECEGQDECLQDQLQKFWEIEEPDRDDIPLSEEERRCEEHFSSTHQRNEDGSYTVELPFKEGANILGHSRTAAVKRFKKIEARLSLQPELKNAYIQNMHDYIGSNFMELIPNEDLQKLDSEVYYMPHHVVVKESSSTTKYRICYDASAKTSSGYSLNDILMTGPKLQVDLVPLLIRFRSHLIAMSADIVKFYPQIRVSKRCADFQRLIWRDSPDLPLQEFRMTRVTFGVTSAPYLAIRCLRQLADDEEDAYPLAVPVIKNNFLVDNLLSGADDVPTALGLQEQILGVMKRGKLKLRKWSSNNQDVLEPIPLDERDTQPSLRIDNDDGVKTIGLIWQPSLDTFGVSIVTPDMTSGSSKRKVLSSIARIFDPLGWLSPVTIRPKILMQKLWMLQLDWDTSLPPDLHKEWITYLLPRSADRYELHGFCDSSKLAYAACVYVRTIDEDGNSQVNLVAAKTKVAPVKIVTIPRLELCGAVLLGKLMKTIRDALDREFTVIRCWTDSTTVLDWLASTSKLEVFISNRVRTINALFPHHLWHYVKGTENPADCATRGVSASELITHPLWLHGPPWLSPMQFESITVSMATTQMDEFTVSNFINNSSSFTRMRRVIAFCLRFIRNSRKQKEERTVGTLTTQELAHALTSIVLIVQAEEFREEIKQCRLQKPVKTTVKFLSPFLDADGVLRVGGRLELSSISREKKHPILLPRRHNLTDQIARSLHLTYLHAGRTLLLAIIRERFWILRGPDVVKRIVQNCVVCHRQNPTIATQLMGQLPLPRVTPSRTFSQCGLDYAGPFKLCLRGGRNPLLVKSYVSIFVCMATRAIHLEWVSDLTTQAFIAALTRFVSRRSLPDDIYCDGGLNFQGAKNEMEEFKRLVSSQIHNNTLSDFLSGKGVNYHFNPPYGPHHGGLWEAGVRSMKYHLKRVVEDRHLSIEEFTTLLSQVEACLNSRPLTPMSNDPNDFGALTPGHFLVGDSLAAHPQHDLTHLKMSHLSRWQVVQQMSQHFWKRWSSEYLSQLQSRPKWLIPAKDIQVGTLVLCRDENSLWGPLKWKLGRISSVFPGSDGKTRVVDVTTPNGSVYRRPIVKISPLPIYE